ncbi:MAG: TRAM domain-containing protein, partial [Verrucomicrobiota bacterium]
MRPPKKFHPHPFAYHEEIELSIDTLTNLGKGLGRVDEWVVFVPYCLPGETVRARVYRNDKRYSEADLVEVLVPSPDRVDPNCPLFQTCGGCQYQHLAYGRQLEWKRRQVAEVLQHLAKLDLPVQEVLPSPVPYGYRSKITPHFQKPRDGRIEAIGFLKTGRRSEIVDVEHCPIALDDINGALPEVRQSARDRAASYKKGATLLLRGSRGADGWEVLTDPKTVARETVGALQ